jgi:hypothetical protein
MKVCVFTNKETILKKIFPKSTQFLALTELSAYSPQDTDISYIDVTGFTNTDLKKTLTLVKKICKNLPWGIIDPKGNIKDSAAMFFEGASDYLGQGIFKDSKSLDTKRFKEAFQWRSETLGAAADSVSAKEGEKTAKTAKNGIFKTEIKLPPASAFPGWKKINTGKTMPFYLLYCSLQGKTSLDTRFEEKALAQVHKRFLNYLNIVFSKGDGLLWMDSGKDCLFLLPAKAKCAEAAVEACIRMIISAPLITLETLAIKVPVNFVFALHYGPVSYKPPGKTGTVVSDAVNAIFHLGAKKAEPGRLTVSGELPDGSIPKSLEDCFVSAGIYEGRKIWHSRKFSYEKPWV